MTGRCAIKYIHLRPDATPSSLHEPSDFELEQKVIEHSTFEELHDMVFRQCPEGYRCIEPIALRHEVLWGMRFLRDENGKLVAERDQLIHALEEKEYTIIDWRDPYHMICLCVDVEVWEKYVVLESELTSSGRPSRVRLGVP